MQLFIHGGLLRASEFKLGFSGFGAPGPRVASVLGLWGSKGLRAQGFRVSGLQGCFNLKAVKHEFASEVSGALSA